MYRVAHYSTFNFSCDGFCVLVIALNIAKKAITREIECRVMGHAVHSLGQTTLDKSVTFAALTQTHVLFKNGAER